MFNYIKYKILFHFETKLRLKNFNLYFLKISTGLKMIINKFLPKIKSKKN